MPEIQHTLVSIFNKKFSIVIADHDEDLIHNAAKIVDDSMKSLSVSSKNAARHQIAILTALDLVVELLALQEDYESTESEYAIKAEYLKGMIGRALFDQIKEDSSV